MIFSFLALCFAIIAIILGIAAKKAQRIDYFSELSKTYAVDDMVSQSVIDFASLTPKNGWKKLSNSLKNTFKQLGNYAAIKLIVFLALVSLVAFILNNWLFQQNLLLVLPISWLLSLYLAYQKLVSQAQKHFEESFPDALNMMVSSVSAGESLLHSISFVGKKLDTVVGREFKNMAERIHIGENVDEVLKQSCQRLPYTSFQFFVITLRANISRGGQLKDIIAKISRLLFDNRALAQKKLTMTAEARASAKIVCAIPFTFLLLMRFLMPENYQFIMENDNGRVILYYLLGSEVIGMTIIYRLLKSIKS